MQKFRTTHLAVLTGVIIFIVAPSIWVRPRPAGISQIFIHEIPDESRDSYGAQRKTAGRLASVSQSKSKKAAEAPYSPFRLTPKQNTSYQLAFCQKGIDQVYTEPVNVCQDKDINKTNYPVNCYRSQYHKVSRCDIDHPVLRRSKEGIISIDQTKSDVASCNKQEANFLTENLALESGNPMITTIKNIHGTENDQCSSVDNRTLLVYNLAHAHHVYFRIVGWYEIFKALHDYRLNNSSDSYILYKNEDKREDDTIFNLFERALFNNVNDRSDIAVNFLQNNSHACFRKAIVVPNSFSSVLFRCKMIFDHPQFSRECFECDKRRRSSPTIELFEAFILNKCGIFNNRTDSPLPVNETKNIVITIMERNAYARFKGDKPERFERHFMNFQKIQEKLEELENDNETSHWNIKIRSVDFAKVESVCAQVQLAHDSDILIGVHGAGLVHLWWLKPESLLIEIEPRSQVVNRTFKMLSTLTGKRYEKTPEASHPNMGSGVVGDEEAIKNIVRKYLLDLTVNMA